MRTGSTKSRTNTRSVGRVLAGFDRSSRAPPAADSRPSARPDPPGSALRGSNGISPRTMPTDVRVDPARTVVPGDERAAKAEHVGLEQQQARNVGQLQRACEARQETVHAAGGDELPQGRDAERVEQSACALVGRYRALRQRSRLPPLWEPGRRPPRSANITATSLVPRAAEASRHARRRRRRASGNKPTFT